MSLLFLEGLHMLNHTLKISGTKHLCLTPAHNRSDVGIDGRLSILFEDVTHVHISNLTLYGTITQSISWRTAGYNYLKIHTVLLQHLIIYGFMLDLPGSSHLHYCKLNNSTINICTGNTPNFKSELTLYETKTVDSIVLGLNLGFCRDLELKIIGCVIDRCHDKELADYPGTVVLSVGPASNLHVEIADTWVDGEMVITGEQENNNISLYIHRSEIKNSNSNHNTVSIELGYETRDNIIHVQITDSKISNAKMYGLILEADLSFANIIEIFVANTSISNHEHSGAIKVRSNLNTLEDNDEETQVQSKTVMKIDIQSCNFTSNKVGVIIEVESSSSLRLEVLINACTFYGNKNAINCVSKSLQKQALPTSFTSRLHISLRKVTIENNSPHLFKSGVINLYNVDMLRVEDCRIANNQGTAIESYYSAVTLTGNTLFENNTGIKGGALLLRDSYMYLNDFSSISFFNNYAQDVGGAIYVKQRPDFQTEQYEYPYCFYQIKVDLLDSPELILNFKSNLALNGGDDIYGVSLYSCWSLNREPSFDRDRAIAIHTIFHFQNKTLSSVTADQTRVCLCDKLGAPQCANIDYIYRELPPRYSGEVFTVSAVVVGYDFGTVPGIVHSKMVWRTANNITLEKYLQVQEIREHTQCGLLNFSIQSQLTNETSMLQLYVQENKEESDKSSVEATTQPCIKHKQMLEELLSQNVHISLTLQDCPSGFILKNTPPHICTCHPTLEESGNIVCIITNHTGWVYRMGTVWVSDSFSEDQTNSFVVHHYCPYDYCKPENISVDLKFPNTQCAINHSGVLCGGCYENLSLALGTSRCLPCDNRYVSLLMFFIFAGLALVFYIKILDLTVAKGTINGLIFYANIVWANKTIIFKTTNTLHPVQHILYTFIAWLNLDLGIETCFIDGLDAYWKTWLQFVFPLYVWTITGVVIIASHYSTRVSKIFGNNSVPVLATLILLSYAKLLRTIITSLGFSLLDYPEGTRVVWSFDGNVPYFGAAHTIMFLVALSALLLLWLPYTTILLTLQWLRRKSYLKRLRWINRWKPFFDAYFGQLKPKHHYWVGLLLLVRVVLLVLFAVTSAVAPRINILAIAILGLSLFVYMAVSGLMYKSAYLSIFEGSFIVNLTVLAITKLYMLPNVPGYIPIVYTSIGIVFIEFLGIIIYHTWNRLKSTYLTYKRRHGERENSCTDRELRVVAGVPHSHMHYREPLLDSSVQDN